MTTTNSSWLTSTNEEYYEVPYKSINAPIMIPFSITIADAAVDVIGDVINFVKIPQSSKLLFMYYAISKLDSGTECDLDIQITETLDGTTTTTTLLNGASLGQSATSAYVFPAVSASFLHEGTPTDDGTATIRMAQIATFTPGNSSAGTVKGFVVYI